MYRFLEYFGVNKKKENANTSIVPVHSDQSKSEDIRHNIVNVSGFDVLEITLSHKGAIYTRAECQMNLENTLELYATVGDKGIMHGIFRSFSTGTFFLNRVSVKPNETTGKLTIFSIIPGNIQAIRISPGDTWCIHHSALIACSENITITTGMSFHQTVTGNGTFYSRAKNESPFPGIIWLVAYGGIVKRDLNTEGSNFRLHSGLFLATKSTVYETMSVELASTIFSTIAGGQGIMMNFEGYKSKKGGAHDTKSDKEPNGNNDDYLYYQTGNLDEFFNLISMVVAVDHISYVPFSGEGGRRKTRRIKKKKNQKTKRHLSENITDVKRI
jgi:uncharacterized protein (AIM24 family)